MAAENDVGYLIKSFMGVFVKVSLSVSASNEKDC